MSEQRTLAVLACGGLCGLILAGYGLFSVPATNGSALPPEAAARVNGGLILMADLQAQVEAVFEVPYPQSSEVQRQEVLDGMIAEELLVQRGLEVGMPATSAEVREALVNSVRRQSEMELEARPPSDTELRAWHAAYPQRFASVAGMQVHHLWKPLAQTQASPELLQQMASAARDLRAGKTIEQTRLHYHLQRNPLVGQEFQIDAALTRVLGNTLLAAGHQLANGAISDPIVTTDGVHLLICISNRQALPQNFDRVRAQVLADFQRENAARRAREYVQFLREKASIVLKHP